LMRFRRWFVCAIVAAWACAVGPKEARAQGKSPHRLHWQSDWRRVNGMEYALTTGLFAAFVGAWFLPPLEQAVWTRPLPFDRTVRSALRARSRGGRNLAGTVSDALIVAEYLPPLLVDPLVVAGATDGNPDVAWQLFVISTEAYAVTITLNEVGKRIFARQRPYAFACTRDSQYSVDCDNADRFRSFYSGHSAIAGTGAGLTCAHHTHLPLYGGPYDPLACVTALAGMLATGSLRVIADKHWNSDVAVGLLLGFSVGYLLPSLIYYKGFQAKPDSTDHTPQNAALSSPPSVVSAQFAF
jgi:membrane-associated phospholipid phosphatase